MTCGLIMAKSKHIFISEFTKGILLLAGFLMFGSMCRAQDATVSSAADTTNIRIGEQITFAIEVETDTVNQVFFPEGQTFLPLEVVTAHPVDTLLAEDKYSLIKKYALTQFDSGAYTIPVQQIMVSDRAYFTDSVPVLVNTVAVDTTVQKMYDIKALQKVNRSYSHLLKYILFGILLAAVIFGIWYRYFRNRPMSEEELEAQLPPYERALQALKRLDDSKYLIQSAYKDYYSDLTNIVRAYLEDDLHITALESTTSELITKLEMLRDAGNIELDEETIDQFRSVLETADLVKFAKSVPDTDTISHDRKLAEELVNKTHDAVVPEEDLADTEALVAQMQAREKRERRRVVYIAVGFFLVLILSGVTTFLAFRGQLPFSGSAVYNTMLSEEWIGSDYGYPAIYVESPDILKRTTDQPWPEEVRKEIFDSQVFTSGKMDDPFYINLRITTFKKGSEIDGQTAMNNAIKILEESGVQNMILKEEQYTTTMGKEGLKVFGTMSIPNRSGDLVPREYALYNFTQEGGLQQLLLVYKPGEPLAVEVERKLMNSVDFKKAG